MFRRFAFPALAAVCASSVLAAPAPGTIGFMGLLNTASGEHRNGPVAVTLSLYATPAGGAPLWSETQTVSTTNGLFTAALGSATPFPSSLDFSQSYYVGIAVDGDAQELAPRIPLQGVPYAMFARHVAENSVGSAQLAADPASLAKVSGGSLTNVRGSIGVGATTPVARLDVRGPDPLAGNFQSASTFGTWFNLLNETGGGPAWHLIATGSGNSEGAGKLLFGSGWTGTLSAMNMVLDAAGNVGIGTANPAAKLDVNGEVLFGPGGRYVPVAADSALRTVYGNYSVANGGTLQSGSGVHFVRNGVGSYTVTFAAPFTTLPGISILPSGAYRYTVVLSQLTNTGVTFQTYANDTPTEAQYLNFLAIGSR